ncbi:MAG TPA: hypothetical protein VI541_04375 [Actinomycetota bacterium]|nr:hypothetical protein [Actinomycetota bacterium]
MTAQADERRKILEMVAEGTLTPSEASTMLDSGPQAPPLPTADDFEEITAVRILGTFRSLRVIADASLRGAHAEGRHRARTDGKTLVIEDDAEFEGNTFIFGVPGGQRGQRRVHGRINGREFRLGGQPPALVVRMNPELPLDIEMTAGSVTVDGIRSQIRASLTAGSGRFEGVVNPFDIQVEAGTVRVAGRLRDGRSAVRCSAGKVSIDLDRDSDVRIVAKATLGKISLPDGGEGRESQWAGMMIGEKEATIGQGKGLLDIEAVTGAVAVRVVG